MSLEHKHDKNLDQACVHSREAAQQFFQAQFPQKFKHFNVKTMQSGQPASQPSGWRITTEIPRGLGTVRNLVGISKDKEAYEEWEAWGKHGASAQAEERRWPRWMLPRREAEKWSRERRARGSSGSAHTCMRKRTLSQPTFSEMTTIHYGSLTDLFAECPPTASPAGPSVLHSGLESICSRTSDIQQHGRFQHRPSGYYRPHCSRRRILVPL